jgi:hypothetical protein
MHRFSVRTLMILIVGAAVGLAALRNANVSWASATATVVVAAVATSVLGALPRRSREQSAWAGFAVFSGMYLAVAVGTVVSSVLKDYFGPTVALEYVIQSVRPAAFVLPPGRSPFDELDETPPVRPAAPALPPPGRSPFAELDETPAVRPAAPVLPPLGRSPFELDETPARPNLRRSWLPGAANADEFRSAGHSLFALLSGLIGSVVGRILYARRQRSEAQRANMPDQVNPESRSWRRYLRLTVRALIVLVLVIGGALGWLVRSARLQRDAVGAIAKAGGTVFYDWEWKDGTYISGGQPFARKWLVGRIGVDYFGHPVCVDFIETDAANFAPFESLPPLPAPRDPFAPFKSLPPLPAPETSPAEGEPEGMPELPEIFSLSPDPEQIHDTELARGKITDAALAHLAGLTNLISLKVTGIPITGAGLMHLKGLTNLGVLRLDYTRVTDAGLAHLKGLSNLCFLGLAFTPVTDAGLSHIAGLHNLRSLVLGNTRVTNEGLVHLKGLNNLEFLDLSGTPVTDAGLVHLEELHNLSFVVLKGTKVTGAGLKHLRMLDSLGLSDTHFTDAGLAHLKGMDNLTFLHLEHTEVTDAGLAHLKSLTKLSRIIISGTKVTDAGVDELQHALPNLTIVR